MTNICKNAFKLKKLDLVENSVENRARSNNFKAKQLRLVKAF